MDYNRKNKKNGGYIAEISRQCGHRFCMKGERKWKKEFLSSYSQALTKSTLKERSKSSRRTDARKGRIC